MTRRRSKRELEAALDALGTETTGVSSDAVESVTAEFVTYDGTGETDTPDGWATTTETDDTGATYHVLERGENA